MPNNFLLDTAGSQCWKFKPNYLFENRYSFIPGLPGRWQAAVFAPLFTAGKSVKLAMLFTLCSLILGYKTRWHYGLSSLWIASILVNHFISDFCSDCPDGSPREPRRGCWAAEGNTKKLAITTIRQENLRRPME